MRTTLDLPDDLVKQAKIAAAERGTTLGDLVVEGLREILADMPPAGKRLNLPVVTMPEGHEFPVLTNRQIAELFDEEDIAHFNEVHCRR